MKKKKKSDLEGRFYRAWKKRYPSLPLPERQYKFHPTRKWRFDFAFVNEKIGIEIQGGSFVRGGHNRAFGQSKDYEKQREAVRLGWRVLPFSTMDLGAINSGKIWDCIDCVAAILCEAEEIEDD